jgi:hypothetical protein
MCALFWIEQDSNVYGWFTGARAHELPAAFFMLENYRSRRETLTYRSTASDVYGDWLLMTDHGETKIDPPVPVPESMCHDLERLQDAFVREWLFYESDPTHAREVEQLHARDLPVLAVNVRPARLNKFNADAPIWTYTSPGADMNIVLYLASRWPLDYGAR